MKIAVAGGGISGLSVYLYLQKHLDKVPALKDSFEITIYEPHDLPRLGSKRADDIPSSGGGYGIAPNGMASLKRLDPTLHEVVFRNGFPAPKTVMKSARGWTLGVMPFTDLRGADPECCVMVLREVVVAAMYERIPEGVVVRKKVTKVEDSADRATVYLDDGQQHVFDLVIGADGVWSKTRLAVLGGSVVPEYRGLFTIAGWVSTDYLPPPAETGQAAHAQTVMTFGPNGFFAYTPYITGETKATDKHIRGEATLPAGRSAFWWSRSAQKEPTANLDNAELKRELVERHSSWSDPAILNIINNSEVALKQPTFVMPKVSTWAGKRVVLVGDAAHALPSSSGQGVSQCLEDAEAFADLLIANMKEAPTAEESTIVLSRTFRQYMTVRKAHVEKVLDVGNRAGDSSRDMGFVGEMTMYGFMWAMLKLFGAFFLKTVMDYDLHAEIEKAKQQH